MTPRVGFAELFCLEHPRLAPAWVLCARWLAIAWLVTGHVSIFPRTDAPFIAGLGALTGEWPRLAMIALSTAACLVILFTPRVQTGAALLALLIFAATAASRPWFANNRLFLAALLVCLALADRRSGRWLVRGQVALLYLGASVDKLLDADWRDGRVLHALVAELSRFGALWSPGGGVGEPLRAAQLFVDVAHAFPGRAFAAGASWCVIIFELLLVPAFLVGRRTAIVGSVTLHAAIFTLTGSTFGVFLHAGLGACFVVLDDLPASAFGAPRLRLHSPAPWLLLALTLASPWSSAVWVWLSLPAFFRLASRVRAGTVASA